MSHFGMAALLAGGAAFTANLLTGLRWRAVGTGGKTVQLSLLYCITSAAYCNAQNAGFRATLRQTRNQDGRRALYRRRVGACLSFSPDVLPLLQTTPPSVVNHLAPVLPSPLVIWRGSPRRIPIVLAL